MTRDYDPTKSKNCVSATIGKLSLAVWDVLRLAIIVRNLVVEEEVQPSGQLGYIAAVVLLALPDCDFLRYC
jgi:hypothetical protein